MFNNPNSTDLRRLHDESVIPHIVLVDIPLDSQFDEADPMHKPFSNQVVDVALGACKARTAPGLDGIFYEVIPGVPV